MGYVKEICVIGLLALVVGCRKGADDPALLATDVVRALSQQDWKAVSEIVHPGHGLRFAPCGRVDLSRDVVVAQGDVAKLISDKTVRRWGVFDGTADSIDLTVDEYNQRFIYDRDFAAMTPGPPNQCFSQGNSLNNIPTVNGHCKAVFLEFHAPGTQKYHGMDWRSLRVVFERSEGCWYLIGLVHDEWTG